MSPPLELDGAGTMVNCAVKTEEKKEGGPETPLGAAPSAEPRPHDPPGPPPRDGTDPQALPQVGVTNVAPSLLQTLPSRGTGDWLLPRVVSPHPKELKLKSEALPRFFGRSRVIPGV